MKPQTGEGLLQKTRDTKDSWQPREAGRGKEGVLPRILGGVWPYYGTEFEAPSLQFDLFWVDRDVSVNLATLSPFSSLFPSLATVTTLCAESALSIQYLFIR